MWKKLIYQDHEFGDRYEISKSGKICDKINGKRVKSRIGSHGYPESYLFDATGVMRPYLVHRLVAATYIEDVTGKQVHHKHHKRSDPSAIKLEVLSTNAHLSEHNRGENNSTAVLKGVEVHKICKLLEKRTPYSDIIKKVNNKRLTVDIIGKIAVGKNWVQVSSQYSIPRITRSAMNTFSARKLQIARLMHKGKTIKEIAERLDIDVNSNEFIRLRSCAPRYYDKYIRGEYGLDRIENVLDT